jgi:hypothetical protein
MNADQIVDWLWIVGALAFVAFFLIVVYYTIGEGQDK